MNCIPHLRLHISFSIVRSIAVFHLKVIKKLSNINIQNKGHPPWVELFEISWWGKTEKCKNLYENRFLHRVHMGNDLQLGPKLKYYFKVNVTNVFKLYVINVLCDQVQSSSM